MSVDLSPAETIESPKIPSDFAVTQIDQRVMQRADVNGKTILIVSTGFFGRLAWHFRGLQTLSDQCEDRSLMIMALPSNDRERSVPCAPETPADSLQWI